jgi:hypothetical protein
MIISRLILLDPKKVPVTNIELSFTLLDKVDPEPYPEINKNSNLELDPVISRGIIRRDQKLLNGAYICTDCTQAELYHWIQRKSANS